MRGRRRHPMAWLKKSLARVKRSAKCFTFHCFCLYQVKLRVIRLLLHGIITYLLPYTDILPVSTRRCSKACEFWSPGIHIFLFLLHLGSAGVFWLSAFGLDGPVSRGVQYLAARQPLHSEWRHTCNTVFSQSLASPGWYSRTLEWTNFCWWVRGMARISPKMGWGGGGVLISKLSIPQGPPRAKGENLRFRHFTRTAPEPRSAWAPLAPPPWLRPCDLEVYYWPWYIEHATVKSFSHPSQETCLIDNYAGLSNHTPSPRVCKFCCWLHVGMCTFTSLHCSQRLSEVLLVVALSSPMRTHRNQQQKC